MKIDEKYDGKEYGALLKNIRRRMEWERERETK